MKRDGFVWVVGIQINQLCKSSHLSDKYTGDANSPWGGKSCKGGTPERTIGDVNDERM